MTQPAIKPPAKAPAAWSGAAKACGKTGGKRPANIGHLLYIKVLY
jgi:hypothetical protein